VTRNISKYRWVLHHGLVNSQWVKLVGSRPGRISTCLSKSWPQPTLLDLTTGSWRDNKSKDRDSAHPGYACIKLLYDCYFMTCMVLNSTHECRNGKFKCLESLLHHYTMIVQLTGSSGERQYNKLKSKEGMQGYTVCWKKVTCVIMKQTNAYIHDQDSSPHKPLTCCIQIQNSCPIRSSPSRSNPACLTPSH
jgi:hypothetical protein